MAARFSWAGKAALASTLTQSQTGLWTCLALPSTLNPLTSDNSPALNHGPSAMTDA